MKIKNRFYTSAGVSLISVVMLFSVVLITSNKTNEIDREHELALNLQLAISELDLITFEYLTHREKRMGEQCNIKYNSVAQIIRRADKEKIKSIRSDYISLGNLILQVNKNYKKRQNFIQIGASQEKIDATIALEEGLITQLSKISQSIITDTSILAEKANANAMQARKLANTLVIVLVIILAITVTTTSTLFARATSRPLDKLIKGAEMIGKGNLDYKVGTDAKDEIGQLSRAFDRMTDRLKKNIEQLKKEVTDRKQAEQQLVHAQKLESIGQLAAGIAHEINTPTQYIMDNTRFLKDAFNDINKLVEKYSHLHEMCKSDSVTPELTAEIDVAVEEADVDFLVEEIPNAIQQSQEGLDRVKNIVYAMKCFSHPENENKQSIDINEAIKNTVNVARNEWKYVADVKMDFDSSLTAVPCFPGDFNQVILNLIVNAAHAIGDVSENRNNGKGIISVSTRRDGDWAEIRFSDTGTGIPEDIRARIFDLFFTTKDVGKGTGQGLSLVHSTVVGRHNGTVTLDTEIGKGTTFIIRLPLSSSSSEILTVETV